MAFDPTYRRSWATDFEDIHADALTADARGMLRSLPSSLRAARHDLAVMPPEDAVDALVCLQDLAAMLAADLAGANKEAAEAQAALKQAQAQAVQAQEDARWALAELYYADEGGIFDDWLPLDDRTAVANMAYSRPTKTQPARAEAVRRILAAGGA